MGRGSSKAGKSGGGRSTASVTTYKASSQLKSQEEKIENKSKQNDEGGGLGLNAGYTAVTSTYKRAQKRRKRKFDEWWNGNH